MKSFLSLFVSLTFNNIFVVGGFEKFLWAENLQEKGCYLTSSVMLLTFNSLLYI